MKLTLIPQVFVLLITAHLLAYLGRRIGLPAIAGHLIAGVLLGPSLLGWLHPNPALGAVADIAVLFVVLTAGLEMRMQHVIETFRGRGTPALSIGFLLPAAAAVAIALAFHQGASATAVIAICVAVTALPVALRILSDFNMLSSVIARLSISSSLLGDVLALMVLGFTLQTSHSSNATGAVSVAGMALLKLAVLLVVIFVAHSLCKRVVRVRTLRLESGVEIPPHAAGLTLTLLFVLGLGAISEVLGFSFAIGAFFGAMMVTRELISDQHFERLEHTCEFLTAGLFSPLFLAYQGVQFELGALSQPAFTMSLIAVAIITKLCGGYLVGKLHALSRYDSVGVGIVMNARGVMEMVVASIAFRAGLVDQPLFCTLLLVGIVTTALTPILLRGWQAAGPGPSERT